MLKKGFIASKKLRIFVVGICFTQVVADVAAESPQLLQEGTDTFEPEATDGW